MQTLTEHIANRLTTHPTCTVFENHLAPVFPVDPKVAQQRHAAIEAFARERGWIASVSDPGIRVTFRKAIS
jgi:hypothetical protein